MGIINIISNKHKLEGMIEDSCMVKTVSFTWRGRNVRIGLSISKHDDSLIENAQCIIDTYIDNFVNEKADESARLYYWYLNRVDDEHIVANGRVTGHSDAEDSRFIRTDTIETYYLDLDAEELLIQTSNTLYKCPLKYCDFEEQNRDSLLIPDYEKVKQQFEHKTDESNIEPGKVLLVLANFDDCYFHSLYCIRKKGEEPLVARAHIHVGMFQDSILISTRGEQIDIRYFPHFQNIEFYSEYTSRMPFFVENIGTVVLFIVSNAGTIKLNPGERKQICEENAEQDKICLPKGDLYPTNMIE